MTMDVREELYYMRLYHMYTLAGLAEPVACFCGEPYYPRWHDDQVYMWCRMDDHETVLGLDIVLKMIDRVREIEG